MDSSLWQVAKVAIAAILIAGASWLSGKRPDWAGFIVALPLTTLLALAFSHLEYNDAENSVAFAKSILIAVPLSLVFFIPFLLASVWKLPFWANYFIGIGLLVLGFFVHSYVSRIWL